MMDSQHDGPKLRFFRALLRYLPLGRCDVVGKENAAASAEDNEKTHLIAYGFEHGPKPTLHPAVHKFQRHIEGNASLMRLFEQAFREIPDDFQDKPDEDGHPRIRDYRSMINAIDKTIKKAPLWSSSSKSERVIGCPMNEALVCSAHSSDDKA